MNSFVEEMLMHYGMPRRSGRYPWGSGDNPYQHSGDFLSRVEEMKKSGFTFTDKDGKTYTGEVAIAKSMGLSTTQFRTQISLAKDERRSADVSTAKALREKGYSLNEIAEKMGFANDSSVRSLLNESSEARMNQAKTTAEFLKKQIAEKGMIDVGTGVERELGISKEKLNQALYILEMEGYPIYGGGVPQVTNPGKQTNIKVICPPGTEHKEIYNFENVHSVRDYIKTEARRQQAENRRKDIEAQLSGTKYGIAYADGTERITQLNRSVNNNLMSQIEYLTSMLYSQLGITQSILDGTADEKTMLNYNNRTIEPIISAIVDEMKRKFLTKTARSQSQSISFFRDPFKLVPVNDIAEIADKFTRNEIMTSNEIRQVIGMKPSDDPRADELRNKNLSAPSESEPETNPPVEDENVETE